VIRTFETHGNILTVSNQISTGQQLRQRDTLVTRTCTHTQRIL